MNSAYFVNLFAPSLLELAGTGLTIFLSWAAYKFQQKTGYEVTQARIQILHKSATTGVAAAFQKFGEGASIGEVLAYAKTHIQSSIPDLMAKLRPTAEVLSNIVLDKIEDRIAKMTALKADEVKAAAVAASDAQIREGFAARQATGAIPPMGR